MKNYNDYYDYISKSLSNPLPIQPNHEMKTIVTRIGTHINYRIRNDRKINENTKGLSLEQRFMKKVLKQDVGFGSECWLWQGYIDAQGYGKFSPSNNRPIGCHRWSYTHFIGPISEGLVIDHLCRVRHCCNPYHLEAVSNSENVKRGYNDRGYSVDRSYCSHGHELTDEIKQVVNGFTSCRTCRRISTHKYRESISKKESVSKFQKTHCKKGHEYNEVGKYESPSGHMECLGCRKARESKINEIRRIDPSQYIRNINTQQAADFLKTFLKDSEGSSRKDIINAARLVIPHIKVSTIDKALQLPFINKDDNWRGSVNIAVYYLK